MTPDAITALASVGTLLVITATAIAAFIQLRHAGTSNRLMALTSFQEAFERQEMTGAREALPAVLARLEDPDARRELAGRNRPDWVRPVLPLMRLFETLGAMTRRRIVAPDLVCDLWAPVVVAFWRDYGPLVAVLRRTNGPTLYQNWESLAALSQAYLEKHPDVYPKSLPRVPPPDPWASIDAL